jgi:rhodanese-related sulfurtransferase
MRSSVVTTVLLMLVGCGSPVPDAAESTRSAVTVAGSDPLTTGEVPTIGREEVSRGIADRNMTVVDTHPEVVHVQRRLPGSVNIPGFPYEKAAATTDRLAPTRLPDRKTKLVLYCLNEPCRNSEFVGRRLIELGYTDVSKYPGGMEDWLAAGLPTEGTASG